MSFLSRPGQPQHESQLAPAYQGLVVDLTQEVEVTIVMPCLNEEEAITGCVEEALEALAVFGVTGEVLVVDNASSDGSVALARAAGARVVTEATRGYGNAYRRGITEARGRILVLGDADGTYDFSVLPAFVEPLRGEADMVIGTRLKGVIDPGAMPWLHRRLGNPVLTGVMNLFADQPLSDVYCGMRSLTRESATQMLLDSGGMEFALQMVIEARRAEMRLLEVPIRYRQRRGGHPKLRTWRDGWKSLLFIVTESLRFRYGDIRRAASPHPPPIAPSESTP